ncbi:MAG: hypothetical protein HYR72_14155 [Deltaproteobacteria bacterium]|nr:hypothetical protein [Deltaproteobacteria bacterium]MBI3391488.1 hypothetical protein [Deltaproteobacteria bacterium]
MSDAGTPARRYTALAAIVGCIAPEYPALNAATRVKALDDVTRYVASQIDGMPSFLRAPYRLALLAFSWLPLLRYARPFSALPAATQLSYLTLWSDGPIGPMRDFVKLIRSCALLAYFDHPLVLQQLEVERA